jgi:hypothetical protein
VRSRRCADVRDSPFQHAIEEREEVLREVVAAEIMAGFPWVRVRPSVGVDDNRESSTG